MVPGQQVAYRPGFKPYAPPLANDEMGRMSWTSLVVSDILGPPVMWPPDPSDHATIASMSRRVKPCPKFPRSIREESYRGWKLGFINWILGMRQVSVAASLLKGASF